MNPFAVALAHLYEVTRQVLRSYIAMLHEIPEVPAVTADSVGILVKGFEQFENFGELLLRQLLVVGKVSEPDFFSAQLNENLVQPGIILHILNALLARNLVERRLRDIDEAPFDQLRHLPIKERQQQGA